MPSLHRYQLPVEQTGWRFNGQSEIDFAWEYDAPRERLLKLYGKAKKDQWDQATRIDWSTDLDPENPMQLDDRMISINGMSPQAINVSVDGVTEMDEGGNYTAFVTPNMDAIAEMREREQHE